MSSDFDSVLPGATAAGWAAPLYVLQPQFLLKSIAQSNSEPAQPNELSVTFAVNCPLFPIVRRCKRRAFRGWLRGEEGFITSLDTGLPQDAKIFGELTEQDLRLGHAFDRVCSVGSLEGRPCQATSECGVGSANGPTPYCVPTLCHEDGLYPTSVELSNLKGPLDPTGLRSAA
eukprot:758814-Hanusia_phi.AAC.6